MDGAEPKTPPQGLEAPAAPSEGASAALPAATAAPSTDTALAASDAAPGQGRTPSPSDPAAAQASASSSETAPARTSTPAASDVSSTRTSTPAASDVSSTRTSTPSSSEAAPARVSAPPSSETPQTATIAPALSQPDRTQGRAKRPSWRMRALLAVLGGLAALGVLAFPFVVHGGGGDRAPGVSNAASMGLTVSAAAVTRGDEGGTSGDDGGSDEDAAPPKPAAWRVARLADDPTVALVEGTMGKRPFLAALASAGIPRAESHRIVASLQDVRDVDHFDAKDSFVVARDKASGHVVAFEVSSSPVDVWQAREDAAPDGTTRLVTRRLELVAERVRIRKAVLVGADLRASFADAGFAPIDEVLALLDDALDGHAELSDIRPGARLRIVATLERVDGAFVRWASLDAVEYLPASPDAPAVRVYWFGEDDHRHGWFDSKGRQPSHGGWRMPIPLAHVVSPFNPHRMHPVLHVVMPHNGVDLRASTGTPVYATAAGVVTSVGDGGPCGNKVEISHPGNVTSIYCHLSRFAAGLHVGQHVEGRQLIAYVGQTGRVTGPHLHFGIKRGGQFIDPMTLRMESVRVVPRGRRDEFDRLRSELDVELDGIPLPAPPTGGEPPPAKEETETFYEEP